MTKVVQFSMQRPHLASVSLDAETERWLNRPYVQPPVRDAGLEEDRLERRRIKWKRRWRWPRLRWPWFRRPSLPPQAASV